MRPTLKQLPIRLLGFFLGALILLFSACEDNDSVAPPEPYIQHKDYALLEKGLKLTYQLDSIVYNNFNNSIDTTSYQVVHTFQEKLQDSGSLQQYLIKRTVRKQNGSLLGSALYTSRLTAEEFQVFRNNRRELRLKFPISADASWDGNVYNNRDSQIYMVEAIHEPASVLGNSYDSTLLIQEEQEENLIRLNAERTRYAKEVGRIYEEEVNLRFRGDSIPPEDVPWEEKANAGNIVRYRLKNLEKGS